MPLPLRTKAFTLVEMLVVIAIIAILAAIAFPAYNSFIARGAAAACISNLRNLGVAMTSYAADNGGRLPGPCYTGINPSIKNNSSMQVAYELRNYLGLPSLTSTAVAVKAVQCPGVTRAFLPAGTSSAAEINSYIIYSDNDMPSGKKLLNTASATDSSGTTWNSGPFGRTAGLKMPGWPIAILSSKINPNVVDQDGNPPSLSTIPAVYEPNNDLEYRGGKKWPWGVPEKCPHGKNMNVLFFDWHVGQVPANAYSDKGTVWKKR